MLAVWFKLLTRKPIRRCPKSISCCHIRRSALVINRHRAEPGAGAPVAISAVGMPAASNNEIISRESQKGGDTITLSKPLRTARPMISAQSPYAHFSNIN